MKNDGTIITNSDRKLQTTASLLQTFSKNLLYKLIKNLLQITAARIIDDYYKLR